MIRAGCAHRAAARGGARGAAPAAVERLAASRMRRSSRCSKDVTARRASSRRRRWRFRSRRRSRRWSPRAPRSRCAIMPARGDARAARHACDEPRRAAADARGRDGARARTDRPTRWRASPSCGARRACTPRPAARVARAARAAGRPGEIPALVDQLVKRKVYDAEQGELLRGERARGSAREPRRTMRRACARIGRACRRTTGCSRRWRAPPRRASCNSAATARQRRSSRKSLERNWDSELVAALRRVPRPPIRRGSSKSPSAGSCAHNQDATLLYTLGRLCERQQLWGKAQTYLEASLALDNHWRAHVALGEMLAKLDRTHRSRCAFRRRAAAWHSRSSSAADSRAAA